MKRKKHFFIIVLLFITVCAHASNDRYYTLDKLLIDNVDFKSQYNVRITYSDEIGTQKLPLNSELQFSGYTDNAGYVKEVTLSGTVLTIKFRRRTTSAPINGTITIDLFVNSNGEIGNMTPHSFSLSYRYPTMTVVDPGEISGPSKYHVHGEKPKAIKSLYTAIPLAGTQITYSWEKRDYNGTWQNIDNVSSEHLYPDSIRNTSDYYRRKATDCEGNSAYSNTVEILPALNAGTIGLSYNDIDATLTLTNITSPNSEFTTTTWLYTADLETWNTLSDTTLCATVEKPSTKTYYRRVVTTLAKDEYGNRVKEYSNIVCYNTGTPAGIHIKSYWKADSTVSDFEYVDGLGRLMQTVAIASTSDGKDVVTAYKYDNKGRKQGIAVPFVNDGNGVFATNALHKCSIFHGDDYAFTQQLYENSPLDRPTASYKPGADYQGADIKHCSTLEYDVNAKDELLKLIHTANGFTVAGAHPAATLHKTVTTDEDGTSLILFVDALGKKLLERRAAGNGQYADTYFVYDIKGRLATVVSPQGSTMLIPGTEYSRENALVKDYCYIYNYDNDDRLTMKRLPGSCAQYFEYDTNGRLTICYDEEMLQSGIKKHIAYDALGREIGFRYESDYGACCQQRNLYDNYDTNCYRFVEVNGIVTKNDTASAKGKITYDRTFEIFSEWASEVRERTYYYDKRGRCVQIITSYPMGFSCRTSVKYDYAGNPLKTLEEYSGRSESLAILTECTFDRRGRKLTEQTSVDGAVVGRVAFTYDEQGRVTRTLLNDRIAVTATYNLQGWLTGIAADNASETIFSEVLRYYNATDSKSSPYYSGKISELDWQRNASANNSDRFVYHYNLQGYLSSTEHRITGVKQSTDGSYSAEFTYDLTGNILVHNANKGGANQQLCYTYNGNHIATVTMDDATIGTAQYDSRGNITKIPGENLQIAYNLCNLPQSITTGNGTSVNYGYLSDGTKYRAVSDSGEKFIYAGSLRFKIENDNVVPESFAIAGGRVTYNDGSWQTNYYITDHLGSVRAVTDANGNVLAEYDYTPYGELLTATDSTATGTDHLFTGKEQQGKLGVSELYDSHARFMNTTGSFLSMDPLAEKYYHLSPYAYCAGDPVNLVDPDGRKIYFRKNVPEWVKERFAATIQYMNEKGTSWIFKKLQDSDNVYYIGYDEIKARKKGATYNSNEKTIYWSPNVFLKTENCILFPATILAHEASHALQHEMYGYEKYKEMVKKKLPKYKNELEQDVIINYEQSFAVKHGDTDGSKPTRMSHSGEIKQYETKEYDMAAENYRESINEDLNK